MAIRYADPSADELGFFYFFRVIRVQGFPHYNGDKPKSERMNENMTAS